jgi:type 1 glutamine amidotransferase
MSRTRLRTAVFCNDTWHPAALIRSGLAPLARDEFSFDWLETPAAWSGASLPDYDMVVLAKGNTTGPEDRSPWLTPEIENAFVDYTRSGKGIFFLHAGTCYRENARLRALTGGAFLKHPPPSPLTLEGRDGHPITQGTQATTFIDEHYEIILDDPSADVFLRTHSQHGRQPAGWTRQEYGRVCALAPGHSKEAWADAQFLQLLDNSLRWTASLLS